MTVRPAKTQISLGIRPVWSVFAVRSVGSLGPELSSCGQRRLRSDWADVQADPSLRWTHTHFCWFGHEVAHNRIADYSNNLKRGPSQILGLTDLIYLRTNRREIIHATLKTFIICECDLISIELLHTCPHGLVVILFQIIILWINTHVLPHSLNKDYSKIDHYLNLIKFWHWLYTELIKCW